MRRRTTTTRSEELADKQQRAGEVFELPSGRSDATTDNDNKKAAQQNKVPQNFLWVSICSLYYFN